MKSFISLRIIYYLTVIFLVAAGCREPASSESHEYLLQSLLWYQQSAEMEAIYYQSFNLASAIIKAEAEKPREKKAAVVLDIDETILDNSPFTGYQVMENVPYSDSLWKVWCRLSSAEPLPGSVAFTHLAADLGMEVFYVSNRNSDLIDVTLLNMKELGFPGADSTHVLLKTGTSSKDARRGQISDAFDIVMLIGDNLGDFDGMFDDRKGDHAKQLVEEHESDFGTKYIILPNPMYGAWEKTFREGPGSDNERRLNAVRSFERKPTEN